MFRPAAIWGMGGGRLGINPKAFSRRDTNVEENQIPIRLEYRKYYDARWRKFRLTALEAAGNVCQRCGQAHRLLNVAHLSHDPASALAGRVVPPLRRQERHAPKARDNAAKPGQ